MKTQDPIDELIYEAQGQIDWLEKRIAEEKLKLSVYYTARDAVADNPLSKKMSDDDMAEMQTKAEKELSDNIMQEELKSMPDWTDMENQEISK